MSLDIEKIIREYIDRSIHMSLATSVDNKPWVSELHFVYDQKLNLYWRSLSSRRHSLEIKQNPNVAGNIVAQHKLQDSPHAIYFEGRAEIVASREQREQILPAFISRLDADEDVLDEAENESGHQFYKIIVENWYAFGKFGGDSSEKYELTWNGGQK